MIGPRGGRVLRTGPAAKNGAQRGIKQEQRTRRRQPAAEYDKEIREPDLLVVDHEAGRQIDAKDAGQRNEEQGRQEEDAAVGANTPQVCPPGRFHYNGDLFETDVTAHKPRQLKVTNETCFHPQSCIEGAPSPSLLILAPPQFITAGSLYTISMPNFGKIYMSISKILWGWMWLSWVCLLLFFGCLLFCSLVSVLFFL